MKKLTLIVTLLFSTVIFSSSSYSGWKLGGVSENGESIIYENYESVKKVGKYVYWWSMVDYLEPYRGLHSMKMYHKGDCRLFRIKTLSFIYHKKPMGRDKGITDNRPDPKWRYPEQGSGSANFLKEQCR